MPSPIPIHGLIPPDKDMEPTVRLMLCIQNDERLYDLCKTLYADGYTSWGSMGCKIREQGRYWLHGKEKVDLLGKVRAAIITTLLKELFHPNNK
jgi:hypothetical protein